MIVVELLLVACPLVALAAAIALLIRGAFLSYKEATDNEC